MLNAIVRIMSCFAAITLVACTSHNLSVKQVRPFADCKIDCQQGFKTCSQVCHNNCQECSLSAKRQVIKKYKHYMREQSVQGGSIVRELKSFRDPLQCRKMTCNCNADYNTCIQSCAGLIHKHLKIAPACC